MHVQVCYYRDKNSINKFQMAKVSAEGVTISGEGQGAGLGSPDQTHLTRGGWLAVRACRCHVWWWLGVGGCTVC